MDNAQLVLEDILKRGKESLDRLNKNMKANAKLKPINKIKNK
ncbi:hypothetical protein U729_3257 (plasmid) [Clostridium baratii str. Sullivan]|uniref:Uncharacterized protein n=1 Tax=Clostridium baratii str. Sullivan TaxID=1415775 RepID=A0A0A7FZZ3_9CLOT|nr:hypothetical protein [Clostridium baratii]AIY85199.1 hypothetical protein U729_3257 [Clostridium baratii str. Sullivan]